MVRKSEDFSTNSAKKSIVSNSLICHKKASNKCSLKSDICSVAEQQLSDQVLTISRYSLVEIRMFSCTIEHPLSCGEVRLTHSSTSYCRKKVDRYVARPSSSP
jgi:hypothetical protein